ncbi:MAG: YceI family protein [Bacteroidota bacterium]
MKKSLLILAFAAMGLSVIASNPTSQKSETVRVDPAKSTLKWHAEKVTGKHDGTARILGGTFIVDGTNITGGTVEVDMNSIDNTDMQGEYHDKLVGHLKSDDFFGVTNFPKATLAIKKVVPIADKKAAENVTVTADLTIKGITKEISFLAIVVIGKTEIVTNADININRTNYGIKYGSKSFIEGIGDKAINDDFNIKVRIVASK